MNYKNPEDWGKAPIIDKELLAQMKQDKDWDKEQLNTPLNPEIKEMIDNRNKKNDESR
jgi:hypothetical protein